MHCDDQLDSWLPESVRLPYIHLGSPICMRIVSNFAIAQCMVPSAWEREWMWYLDLVSVERCGVMIREDRR